MELNALSCIILLALTGFFTAFQFGLTWPYSSEAGGREYHINVISAITAGLAFFLMVLLLLLVVAHFFAWIPDWANIYRTAVNWCVWIVIGITALFGGWAYLWRRNEKRNQFQEFMERASSHFQVNENVPSTYHPYRTDFIFLDWGRPEYTSGLRSSSSYSSSSGSSISLADGAKGTGGSGGSWGTSKSSEKSAKDSGKKGGGASGLAQLLVLLIIFIVAALSAYALVHFIAKWAIGVEEDWIRDKRGWVNSDLVAAYPVE